MARGRCDRSDKRWELGPCRETRRKLLVSLAAPAHDEEDDICLRFAGLQGFSCEGKVSSGFLSIEENGVVIGLSSTVASCVGREELLGYVENENLVS